METDKDVHLASNKATDPAGYLYVVDRFPSQNLGYKIGMSTNLDTTKQCFRAYRRIVPESEIRFCVHVSDRITLENRVKTRFTTYRVQNVHGNASEVVIDLPLDKIIRGILDEAYLADIKIEPNKPITQIKKQQSTQSKPLRGDDFYIDMIHYLRKNNRKAILKLLTKYDDAEDEYFDVSLRSRAFNLAIHSDTDIILDLIGIGCLKFIYLLEGALRAQKDELAREIVRYGDKENIIHLNCVISDGSDQLLSFILQHSTSIDLEFEGYFNVFTQLRSSPLNKILILLGDRRVKGTINCAKVLEVVESNYSEEIKELLGRNAGSNVSDVGFPSKGTGFWEL